MADGEPYLLGVSEDELRRMRFQHGVWKPVTEAFLDRLGVGLGWSCLDVGAGPGFVTLDLCERVGVGGAVTALEPSMLYCAHLRRELAERRWANVDVVCATAERAGLPERSRDLVLARWVLDFVPDRPAFLAALARTVDVGGVIAAEDYWYEGLSVYPRGTPFDDLPDIARAYYASGGGDAHAIADMPSILGPQGFELVDLTPRQQAGGMDSAVFCWAAEFFRMHLPIMAARGVIDIAERDRQLANLDALSRDPRMIFFSPIVLDCAMRRTG